MRIINIKCIFDTTWIYNIKYKLQNEIKIKRNVNQVLKEFWSIMIDMIKDFGLYSFIILSNDKYRQS